ncbi:MAG TPA: hypothetical protein VN873_15360 [Candidatus Angelobacter sp.]|nr:hypothetical protein [Candidatus Angelobacter sp.]
MKKLIGSILPLLLLTLGSGCTIALWKNPGLEAWNQPANDPHLRLFAAKPPGDILVVYNEYAERSDTTHARAYWLNQNENLIENRHAPHFVSTNSMFCLAAVPVFASPPNEKPAPSTYAVVDATRQSFTLYSDTTDPAPHDLPHYNDGKGKVEKFFLTPAAITVDATLVGGVLGYAYLESMTSGYNSSY